MSAPHVTGAAALLSMYNPALSAASLKATLINSADVLPQFAGLNRAGGRLNVARALTNQTVCSFGLGSNSMTVPTKGGTFSVNVTAAQNCDFSAKSNVNWVHVTSGFAMTGNDLDRRPDVCCKSVAQIAVFFAVKPTFRCLSASYETISRKDAILTIYILWAEFDLLQFLGLG
jgi:hypothetical protein